MSSKNPAYSLELDGAFFATLSLKVYFFVTFAIDFRLSFSYFTSTASPILYSFTLTVPNLNVHSLLALSFTHTVVASIFVMLPFNVGSVTGVAGALVGVVAATVVVGLVVVGLVVVVVPANALVANANTTATNRIFFIDSNLTSFQP